MVLGWCLDCNLGILVRCGFGFGFVGFGLCWWWFGGWGWVVVVVFVVLGVSGVGLVLLVRFGRFDLRVRVWGGCLGF